METIDELEGMLGHMLADDALDSLLDRASICALVRREGRSPADTPSIDLGVAGDITDIAFSLLRICLALRERQSASPQIKSGFLSAGRAFHTLVRNGDPLQPERSFWRVMGAVSYHLSGHSATAYALINKVETTSNYAPSELVIIHLILRDLKSLRDESRSWIDRHHTNLPTALEDQSVNGEAETYEIISTVLTTTIYRSFAHFEFALAIGKPAYYKAARELLQRGLQIASRACLVTLWWIIRVARHLIDDLWTASLNHTLPTTGPTNTHIFPTLRKRYLALLHSRSPAEIELWPSQVNAAIRAGDISDNLVVSLPTGAGKTRIAEICALMTLSQGKHVIVVTPLRALCSQMERSYTETFGPLGFSVSSLYGADSLTRHGDNPLRTHDIVVITPEKLDLSLRIDSSLIDDYGLVILDEGHMIGPSERELRFELLIQRLLRRSDADSRRIVVLSAILSRDETCKDFIAWIRRDCDGKPVTSDWHPNDTIYGIIQWSDESAKLSFDRVSCQVEVPRFLEPVMPRRPRIKYFPRDNRELTIASAWKFSHDGKRVIVYCTQKNWVDQYARIIAELIGQGLLQALPVDSKRIANAKAIAVEWLGVSHPVVICLEAGVAIHHATMPRPFLQELQRLIDDCVFTVIVSSPTLAQGLNIGASVLIVPSIYRSGQPIDNSEFSNVVGRVGRPFVDTDGLVIHTIYGRDPQRKRRRQWSRLTSSTQSRSMVSGLFQVIASAISHLSNAGMLQRHDAFEYLSNSQECWTDLDEDDKSFANALERLDTTIFSLLGEQDTCLDTIASVIEDALRGSLWWRRVARLDNLQEMAQRSLLSARARLVFSRSNAESRRGYLFMGVGLESGLRIDAELDQLVMLLDSADQASISGDLDQLSSALTALGTFFFSVSPFVPSITQARMPSNWPDLLYRWISGESTSEMSSNEMLFIQEAFINRLVRALDGLCMRRRFLVSDSDFIHGGAVLCLETGVPMRGMAMLLKMGLSSRDAALALRDELDDSISNFGDLLEWMRSADVNAFSDTREWPTPRTADLWREFHRRMTRADSRDWCEQNQFIDLSGCDASAIPQKFTDQRFEVDIDNRVANIYTPDYTLIAQIPLDRIDEYGDISIAKCCRIGDQIKVSYFGTVVPSD